MIKRIKKIKEFGIFRDFHAPKELHDFSKFNLFYGWNGCGKTTLTKLLNILGTKNADSAFPSCEFEIVMEDNSIIKQNSVQNFISKIFVFNQFFIEENIDWKKQGAKSIVVISEDNIVERERFFELSNKLIPDLKNKLKLAEEDLKKTEKESNDFLIFQAKSLKNSLQLIDTNDRRYINYDKAKLRDFITQNENKIKDGQSILNEEELSSLRQQVKPIQKGDVNFQLREPRKETLLEAETRISMLVNANILNESIQRLQENPRINSWIHDGLIIHKDIESEMCEFCGQTLPKNRISQLENHFSQAYADLIRKLHEAQNWINELEINCTLPQIGELYEELQAEYKSASDNLLVAINRLKEHLRKFADILTDKLNNPFETSLKLPVGLPDLIVAVSESRILLEQLIDSHNNKNKNFQKELTTHKDRLELHYAADAVREKKYFDLQKSISSKNSVFSRIGKNLGELEEEKDNLEASLSNAVKGAEGFNNKLHLFLGRKDISLEYDTNQKGYKIVRTGKDKVAQNLSEGEKTAIAFVYFITKLNENGNQIEDSIIIVDDPISSFDANHLFHSMSFLKNTCESAKQLFILTHNFQYFRLIRDWILNKNKKDTIKSRVYSIDVGIDTERESTINNAHVSLLNHGSEYHFLFKKLHSFREGNNLNIEHSYHVANYGRKLLEAFFTFKHPKGRNDFSQLMDAACKIAKVEPDVKDKVYRFINKYSHYQIIEIHDSPIDNLLGEGENVTQLIFSIIEKCDETHYNEMIEICNDN